MKRGTHDTEPVGSSRAPVSDAADPHASAHDVGEADSQMRLRAAAEDERLRSLLDGLGSSHASAPTRYEAAIRSEAVHHAPTRKFETPARPQASSFSRGVARGLLVGVPTGFAIGVAVALGAVLLFLPVGGTVASPPPRPSAAPGGATASMPLPPAVVAPSGAPAAADGPPAATARSRGSAQASHDAPALAPARKSPADRPVPEKNTMTNEL